MRNVYSLSLVILILADIWQITEGRCGGGPKTCTDHSDCPLYFACLFGPKGVEKYCRVCPCDLKEQCYVNNNGAVDCDCSSTDYWGPHCNCPPCLGVCPNSFSQFQRTCQCYRAFTTPKLTWENAKLFCENAHIHTDLVSIYSLEENEYVRNILPALEEFYWIGGIKTGGFWLWSTNADITFSNWAPSEPGTSGLCIAIQRSDGRWKVAACNMTLSFVCKFSQR